MGKNEWISVKDRLPEEFEKVIVKYIDGRTGKEYIDITHRIDIYWAGLSTPDIPWNNVMYWMKLPEFRGVEEWEK